VVHANARLTPAGRLLLCRIQTGRPVAHVAVEMGISRTCAYRWWARFQQHGPAGLVDRPGAAGSEVAVEPKQPVDGGAAPPQLGRDRGLAHALDVVETVDLGPVVHAINP
jgi:transposase-like protein